MIPGTEAEVTKTARRNALLAAALFVLLAPGLFAQVLPAGQSPTPKKNAIPKKDTVQAIAAKQPHKSINEIRKETLQFGIDSQVVSLLTTLTQEKDAALGSAVIQLLDQSLNTNVQQGALEYLTAVKNWNATSFAEKLLNDRVQQGENGEGTLIVTAIRYITGAKDANSLPILTKLMQDQNLSVAYEAVSSIGKLGGKTQAASLLADLKDPSFSTKLKPQVILSLGQLKSKEAVPELTKILQNQNSDATERRYACEALGKIGDPASLPVIEKALSSSDTYLRSYAISALANFPGSKVDGLITQGLKDSFWRVRVNAAQTLGKRKVAAAIPILEYKARYDPELVVQQAAVTALGEIDDPASIAFLQKVFSNKLINPALRTIAVDALVSHDLNGSLKEIEKYIQSEWDKPNDHLLDYVCNQLSKAKNPKLEPLFERFLGSTSLNIQIYGLRGIRNNDFKGLLDKVKKFDNSKENQSVRAAAEAAISTLK